MWKIEVTMNIFLMQYACTEKWYGMLVYWYIGTDDSPILHRNLIAKLKFSKSGEGHPVHYSIPP